jgi:hypothetical protein
MMRLLAMCAIVVLCGGCTAPRAATAPTIAPMAAGSTAPMASLEEPGASASATPSPAASSTREVPSAEVPSESATPAPTVTVVGDVAPESATPTPTTPSAVMPEGRPPVALARGDFAKVITDNLRIRSMPWTGQGSTIYEPRLQPGELLYVMGGPVAGSGYWWYRVARMGQATYEGAAEMWVAAGDQGGTPWLARRVPPPGTTSSWSSPGDGSPGPDASVSLDAGVYRLLFTGLARCSYMVEFGPSPDFKLGFQGSTLQTVNWDQGFAEPSFAPVGSESGVVIFPPLSGGDFRITVDDHGSTANPCPWQMELRR